MGSYTPLKTQDGDVFVDEKETEKEAKIRSAQHVYDEQRRHDPTLETTVQGCSHACAYLSMSWLSPFTSPSSMTNECPVSLSVLTGELSRPMFFGFEPELNLPGVFQPNT